MLLLPWTGKGRDANGMSMVRRKTASPDGFQRGEYHRRRSPGFDAGNFRMARESRALERELPGEFLGSLWSAVGATKTEATAAVLRDVDLSPPGGPLVPRKHKREKALSGRFRRPPQGQGIRPKKMCRVS